MSKSIYRDLIVWQKSRELAASIYRVTLQFPRNEMFGLTAQMRRAAISVISNIAEGYGRRTTADVVSFLIIARGSLLEMEAQTIVATDLEFIEPEISETLIARTLDVTRLLNGLIRHLQRNGR
jgi:four helix bundle protein